MSIYDAKQPLAAVSANLSKEEVLAAVARAAEVSGARAELSGGAAWIHQQSHDQLTAALATITQLYADKEKAEVQRDVLVEAARDHSQELCDLTADLDAMRLRAEKAEAECAALRKDAERWRWFMDNRYTAAFREAPVGMVGINVPKATDTCAFDSSRENILRLVDAALSASAGEQEKAG